MSRKSKVLALNAIIEQKMFLFFFCGLALNDSLYVSPQSF